MATPEEMLGEIASPGVQEVVSAMFATAGMAVQNSNLSNIAELFDALDEQAEEDPASILTLLKASVVLGGAMSLKAFKRANGL